MTKTEKQSHRDWLVALAPMIGVASFVMMSLPAQADLTCTNLHESKVSYQRDCRGLPQLQNKFKRYHDNFTRYRERLNNEHGSKSNAPTDIVDKYNRRKREYNQRKQRMISQERSCKSARDSYNIFLQMAREQGLDIANCFNDKKTQRAGNPTPPATGSNNSNAAPKTCPSRGKHEKTYGKGRLQILCKYYSSGRLHAETPLVEGKKHGMKIVFHENGNPKNKKVYWNGHLIKDIWFTKSGKMTDCNKYDLEFRPIGSCK